ncbi:MAG: NAD(P)-dependent glycerol-3-phosphate dehydrogenase [Sedimentisphaerales bacterium]|nr:NAD(P)-dependent glycerol-3-phosphate dehydrogenase [Sedimentisphaerales bacterium]
MVQILCSNTGMFERITIIGDGAMGTVCSMLLCAKGVHVTLWGYDVDQLAEIAIKRENVRFLPGYRLPEELDFEADDDKAMVHAELIVSAVPCQFMRPVWERLSKHTPRSVPIVSVAKGIEQETLLCPTEILADVLGKKRRYAALSGPTIADEIARGLPATATAASRSETLARQIQKSFNGEMFRVYTNADLFGVELCGAVKNVIAIAAGIIDGIGLGDNAKAALLSRGLAEIRRLGLAMGAQEHTFAGLSGLGDLVTTCISPHGRNRSFGERIGRGMTSEQAQQSIRGIVEGVQTCRGVLALAKKHHIEMPITEAVCEVIHEGKSVPAAIHDLMSRRLKAE